MKRSVFLLFVFDDILIFVENEKKKHALFNPSVVAVRCSSSLGQVYSGLSGGPGRGGGYVVGGIRGKQETTQW